MPPPPAAAFVPDLLAYLVEEGLLTADDADFILAADPAKSHESAAVLDRVSRALDALTPDQHGRLQGRLGLVRIGIDHGAERNHEVIRPEPPRRAIPAKTLRRRVRLAERACAELGRVHR